MNQDSNIGFIGLGNVGLKIASRILKDNYNLFINDLEFKKGEKLISNGAIWCDDYQKICEKSSIIITCLPSPEVVKNVIEGKNGLVNYVNRNHLWIEMSTTDENEMKRLSKLFENKNAEVLESPITGGQHRAESGNISILVSGKRKNFDRAFKLLSTIGHEILFCGKIGNASTLKVVTNFLASTNLVSLGEALMVCKKYGIDLRTAYHGIKISSGNSFVHETESKVILNGSYDVGFTMDLVCKDVNLFDKLIDKFNIPAELSNIINKIFIKGLNEYGERSLSTSIVKILEDKCSEDLRADGFPEKLIDDNPKKRGIEIKF